MKYFFWFVLAVLVLLSGFFIWQATMTPGNTTDQTAGPIIDGSENGLPTYINATPDDIVVTNPFPGAVTGKEFTVMGKARGPWYFEASFPVTLLDKDGNILDQKPAQAQGEWMTTDFVPFAVTLKAPDSYIGKATLVIKNDNPSGLPENEKSVSFEFTVEY